MYVSGNSLVLQHFAVPSRPIYLFVLDRPSSRKITQAEINAGSVSNTATVTASAPTAEDGVTKAAVSTEILEHDAKILLGDHTYRSL